jgi:hypothetical protein
VSFKAVPSERNFVSDMDVEHEVHYWILWFYCREMHELIIMWEKCHTRQAVMLKNNTNMCHDCCDDLVTILLARICVPLFLSPHPYILA